MKVTAFAAVFRSQRKSHPVRNFLWLCACLCLLAAPVFGGNFYAGTSPATVPWTGGVIPYQFTNSLTPAQQQTFFDGIREWQLAGNIQFVPRTTQTHWILFTYNTNFLDNVSATTNPQVVTVSSLSRAQVCHEMGHSLGFNHENIRYDRTNYLTVLTNNISPPGNLIFFQVDPTTVTNGPYDFESVMHLGDNFSSADPSNLYTQLALPPYFAKYQPRMGNLCLSPGDRSALAFLYGAPATPLTNIVTTTLDHGPGSLRAAMYYATDHPGSTVKFNIPTSDTGYSNGVFTIHLSGYLPPMVRDGMVIDGSTQPGFAGQPLIIVDGSQMIPEAYPPGQVTGLLIVAANCQVKNLSFQNFNWNGITLNYPFATNNTIAGCWMGPDHTGTNTAPNALQGVLIYNGASGNTIGGATALARNVLSGNTQYGVLISGTNTTGNVVMGNYIGTDFSGKLMLSNSLGGVFLADGANNNVIGGITAGAGNVISGNLGSGVLFRGSNVVNNTIQGNYIGPDASGLKALPNFIGGVTIDTGSSSNLVGGTVSGARNIVSGNQGNGILLRAVMNNVVEGNYIGTDSTGMNAMTNTISGVAIDTASTSNVLGGVVAGARNVISGNVNATVFESVYGVILNGPGTSGNVVEGNYIGLNASGAGALPNEHGITCFGGATNNLIGGTSAGAANFISGNNDYGVFLIGPASNNIVEGNFIGTDNTGTNGVGNFYNVELQGGTTGNIIGGTGAGAGNVIAFAGGYGLVAFDLGTTNNSIRGNSMFDNNYLGIELDGNGINPPVITNAFGLGFSTVTAGIVTNAANQRYIIDVYRNVTPHPTGIGEGKFYMGSVSVMTDGSGKAVFSLTNSSGNFTGQYFSATATSASGDTSEFDTDVLATNRPAAGAVFAGPFAEQTTGFSLMLNLVTNFTYRIQGTTNLAQNPVVWVDLTNFTATTSPYSFIDHSATNFHLRFYRVTSP